MKFSRYPTIIIILILSLALVSCGGGDKEQPAGGQQTQADETSVQQNDQTNQSQESQAQSETSAGQEQETQAGEQGAQPQGEETVGGFTWNDVPLYPGAEKDEEALDMGGTSNEGVRMEVRHFQTNDGFDKVVEFYISQMPESGWEDTQWFDQQQTTEGWSVSKAVFGKNDWHDSATIEITDKGQGTVYLTLLRSNDEGNEAAGPSNSGLLTTATDPISWDDMPVFPDSSTDEAGWISTTVGGDSRSESRFYTTNEDMDKVSSYYKENMVANGWTEIMFVNQGEMTYGMFEKNDGFDHAQITIGKEEDGSLLINLTRLRGVD